MKRLLLLTLIAIIALGLVVSCGKKQEESDKMPAETKEAEMMDSTRMDSAMDEMADSAGAMMEEMTDSAKAMMEEGKEKVEGAVKDAAGQ